MSGSVFSSGVRPAHPTTEKEPPLMSDRTLVAYEEPRLPDGPYWTLNIERSAAGAPGGIITIAYESVDGYLPREEKTIVIEDLRILQPALDWANQ